MVMIALCNDYHFWGLQPDPLNGEDQGDDPEVLEYPCVDQLEDSWHDDSVSKQLALFD